ncbi:MAG: hypothetical protein LBN93_04745 [Candidatus Symbiothrix sp.]|jgi:hypothetical protein|nr:hypothetical protein [Candidatus Symbiothrix sp.]
MQAHEIIDLMAQKKPLTEHSLSELQLLTEEYPYFATAQVLFTLNLKSQKDSRFNANLRKSACYTGDRRQLSNLVEQLPVWATLVVAPSPNAPTPNAPTVLPSAIDSFLEQQTDEQPEELMYAAPADYAEQFLTDAENADESVDTESFFSETLAKIYIKQKKYDKALEIIYKLNLHYPEKSRYFADQMRFLEKLINNSKK